MTFKYKRGILLLFTISLCFNILLTGQTSVQDSIISKQDIIKNVAWGTQPAWKTTGAATSVTGDELTKFFTPNLANKLIGRLPGLSIKPGTGEAGYDSPASLNVRGRSTYWGSYAPLIIIDGFEGVYEDLVPEEIETISLLKDASETAIYGLRGANGVLMVTTKRGKAGPMKIELSAQYGFQRPTNLPSFLGSYDYAKLYNEGLVNDGKSELYTPADLKAYKDGSDPYFHPNVDWYKELLRSSAPISNYNINFKGGNNSVSYFVLFNSISSDGLFIKTGDQSPETSINSSYKRYNFRSNVDVKVTDIFSASLLLGGTIEDKTNPVADNASGVFNQMAIIPPNAFPVYNPNKTFGASNVYSNLLGDMLQKGFFTSNGRTLQSTLKLKADMNKFVQGLSASASISFNNYFRSFSSKSRDYVKFSVSRNLAGDTIYNKLGQNTSLSGSEGSSDQWRNYGIQSFINYNRIFGVHQIDAMLMLNSNNFTVSGTALPVKHVGYGGRFNYALYEKYIAEFSFGYNGTDNFEKGKRYGFFPAASLGWIISKEKCLQGSKTINYLKLRGSFGLVGNDLIGGSRFMFNDYYGGAGGYYFGSTNTSANGIGEGTIANHDVTWEKQKQVNVGLEATLFNRFDVSLDLFNQDRYDILATPVSEVPQFFGAYLPTLNVGKVNNKGFEAMIRYNSDQTKQFKYFIQANAWYTKNKIVYQSEAIKLYDYQYSTGYQIGQPFVLEAVGFFADAADIAASPKQIFTAVQPGDIKYKDQNNDKVIDQNDYVPMGNNSALPKLTATVQTGFSYKGFDLDLFFQGVTGSTVYLNGNYYHAFQNNAKVSEIALGRWTTETAATATYPRLSASNNLNNYLGSTFWQRDGSFIKLRSVELGYTTRVLAKKWKVENVRIFVSGTNLFTFDRIDYVNDPESLSGYPSLRTISMGTKIQF